MSRNSDALPAGGLLLENLHNAIWRAVNEHTDSNQNRVDMDSVKMKMKNNVLKVVVGCPDEGDCWRVRLPNSLQLADLMLDEALEGLSGSGFDAVADLRFVLRSPGLVGAGGGLFSSVFEVGLQMDWLLGLPFYPGSSVKGAVRSLVEGLLGEDMVEAVFGSPGPDGHVGNLVVLDSYPIGCEKGGPHPCLVLTGDVLTPHYYDGGRVVEAESDARPNPIQHVSIAPGTVFRLVAGIRCPTRKGKIDPGAASTLIRSVLKRNVPCEAKGDRCTCASTYALAMATLIAAALQRGFAARSGKGYNVMEPLDGGKGESITRDVVGLEIHIPARGGGAQGRGHSRQDRPRRHGGRRGRR